MRRALGQVHRHCLCSQASLLTEKHFSQAIHAFGRQRRWQEGYMLLGEMPKYFGTRILGRHGGFLKWWYPQNTPKWSFLVGNPHGCWVPPSWETPICWGVVLIWVVLPVKRWPFAITRKCSKIFSKDIDFDIFYISCIQQYLVKLPPKATLRFTQKEAPGANIWRVRRKLGPCKYSFSALCSALVYSFWQPDFVYVWPR